MKDKENIDAWKRYYSLYIYPETKSTTVRFVLSC